MRPRIDLRFRPSLILFIDETGSCICKELQSILHFTGFDPVLRQSVALLLVNSVSKRATRVDLSGVSSAEMVQPHRDADKQAQQDWHDLGAFIDRALRDVQDNRRIQRIIEAGYPIPNTRTQIFIVGDAHSPQLARLLDIVYRRLDRRGFTTLVCYVINAFSLQQITAPTAVVSPSENIDAIEEPGGPDPLFTAERNLPGFCYIYEDMLNYPAPLFVSEEESHYATAEALFTFIATGLTTEPFFETHMQIGTTFGTYENVGTLSTSLIAFPRTNVLEFCSARLGIILMEQWHQDLRNQHTSVSEQHKLQNRARALAQDTRSWIKDSEPRSLVNSNKKHTSLGEGADITEELLCPTLHILQREASLLKKEEVTLDEVTLIEQQRLHQNQRRMHRDLQEETEKLFLLFWPEDINREYRRQKRRFANWIKLVLERGNRAVEAWNEWEKRATRAWDSAAERINTETRALIDYLWSKDQNGFDMATVYVSELDDQIASLFNDLSHWRVEHEESYQQFLTAVERIAQDGAWVVRDDASSILDGQAAQAHPTMKGQHVAANQDDDITTDADPTDDTGNILGVTPTPTRSSSQHLPEREEQIVQNLEQRILWYQRRIPSVATQIVVAIPFILALVLSALAWIPHTILYITLASLSATILVGYMHWVFRLRYSQRVEECKEDLLIFYRRYYAYLCECKEDCLRRNALVPLRTRVQAIHERLFNLQQFVQQARKTLDKESQRVQDELFDRPAGLRDIFVANGERLQRENTNTLADFASQISRLRTREPKEEWHRSSAHLKRQLIQSFRQQSESLMEMSDEALLKQIRTFATDVISPYLRGPHVELQNALDKRDIWMEAIERVENPLYQAQVGIKEPQFLFIGGRDFDIGRGLPYIPVHAYPVRVSDTHEWVLMAAFFRGGQPTTINPDILFPEKSSLVDDDEIDLADDADDDEINHSDHMSNDELDSSDDVSNDETNNFDNISDDENLSW